MRRALSVYKQYLIISLRTAAAYKLDFITTLIITFLSNLAMPLVITLTYGAGASLPGYTYNEAMLIQSVFMLCMGLCSLFFGNIVWITMDHVREGTFDMLLLKPGAAVFITLASSFDIGNAGMFLSGAGLFVVCMMNSPAPSFLNAALFLCLFVMGTLVWLSLTFIMSATTFKWVGNGRLYEIFDSVATFGRYPGSIYKGIVRNAATFVVPVLMLGSFPASALMGQAGPHMLVSSAVCVLLFFFSLYLFNRMISLYQSAGG